MKTQIPERHKEILEGSIKHNRRLKAKRLDIAKGSAGDVIHEETHFHHKLNMIKSVSSVGGFGSGTIHGISCCVCGQKTPKMILGIGLDRGYYCQDHIDLRSLGNENQNKGAVNVNQ